VTGHRSRLLLDRVWNGATSRMVRAIFFDSDGLLVDTERMFFEETQAEFAALGIALSVDQWARWFLGEGKRSREIARLLGVPDGWLDPFIANRNARFERRVDLGVPVLPGVPETLQRLAERFRLAIVTGASRSHFERVHSGTGLMRYFELCVTSDDYDEAKPSPQAYRTALARIELSAGECFAVEDSPRGAVAARAAGLRCAVVPTPLTEISLCPAGCDVVRTFRELPELLTRTDPN